MTTKKQKKIKKTQRNKPLVSNGGYKGHQYQHRYSWKLWIFQWRYINKEAKNIKLVTNEKAIST